MSKYSKYAKQFDEIAKAAFEEFKATKAKFIDADYRLNELKTMGPVDPRIDPRRAADLARAEADFMEARDAARKARAVMENHTPEIQVIRKNLIADIDKDHTASPEQIDNNAVKLMESGIMRGNDYKKLMDEAAAQENVTMIRLIGKYAADAAERRRTEYGSGDTDAQTLIALAAFARNFNGQEYVEAFDYMLDVWNRCVNNEYMISRWDQLTAETVKRF